MQRKEETVSEYTERFCQSAVIYSGIVYCGKLGHWEKECRKKLQDSKRNAMHNSAPSQPAHNPEVVPPVTTETVGQLVQALLRAQQDQEKN